VKRPRYLTEGDRIKFAEEKQAYTVQATSDRYSVCTKPFNPKKTVLYSIVDWEEQVRGTENVIFCNGAETQEQCFQMLVRLLEGHSEVSYRNRIPLVVDWVRNALGEDVLAAEEQIAAILDRH
jgi:hypothetical protein